jgi:hydrogenase expression/formation protein HypE
MENKPWQADCPVPIGSHDVITLGHGSGGTLSSDMLTSIFLPAFSNKILDRLEDQAVFEMGDLNIAMTTDAFVVDPLFFPGGNIGTLAVNGTINDLAVGGAIPKYIAASFIIEEGLSKAELTKVVQAMAEACIRSEVTLVCGDTKVVERGKGDKIYITTTGIGLIEPGIQLSVSGAKPGDSVVISGTIGDHGTTIMAKRENLEFKGDLKSDCAPLSGIAQKILHKVPTSIRAMRDPSRGGLSSTLYEIASASNVGIKIDETKVPVSREVNSLCEILGLDPFYIANEGKLVAIVESQAADRVVAAMKEHPLGEEAAIIGTIVDDHHGKVTATGITEVERMLPQISGEQLPRIC